MSDVFVIDDDDVLRLTVSLLLRSAGHTPHEFSTAGDALRALGESTVVPAVVLLDLQLDDDDAGGAEGFVRSLRAGPHRSTAVYLLSGHRALADRARELGAQGFIEKPFEPRALLALLKSIVPPSIGG